MGFEQDLGGKCDGAETMNLRAKGPVMLVTDASVEAYCGRRVCCVIKSAQGLAGHCTSGDVDKTPKVLSGRMLLGQANLVIYAPLERHSKKKVTRQTFPFFLVH